MDTEKYNSIHKAYARRPDAVFWKTPLTLQHPLSQIEILPWDSSLTLILSKDEKTVASFTDAFLHSERLEEYIEKYNDNL
ncbi:MAG: hypothetical protein IJN48_01415 [Clostridia bacterium]|nr:hypothetical protein [Clostridia bacterium]